MHTSNYILLFGRAVLRAGFACFLVCLLPALSLAQSAATGSITGRVFNPATGEYVRNAEVRIAGTAQVVSTESDGSFRFDRVPASDVTLTVRSRAG